MTPLTYLTRVDPARNMARFYRLDIQPTLFGEWALVREWGRIGSSGQLRCDPFPTEAAAEAAKARMAQAKGKRGYRV